MKNRIYCLFATFILMVAFCIPSFAADYYSSDESGNTSIPEYIESVSVATEGVSIPEKAKNNTYELTPDGNLTLIDDYYEQNEDGEISQKQFLTVTTKSGNTFYIVVDRDGNTDNVYLLNLVDEADLMALMEDKEVTVTTTEESTSSEEETTQKNSNSNTEKKSNNGTLLLIVLVIGAGGFAAYWFKFRKKEEIPVSDDDTDKDDYIDEPADSDDIQYESEDE